MCIAAYATDYGKYYQNLPVKMQQPEMPVIPDYSVNLKDFGAVGDGRSTVRLVPFTLSATTLMSGYLTTLYDMFSGFSCPALTPRVGAVHVSVAFCVVSS